MITTGVKTIDENYIFFSGALELTDMITEEDDRVDDFSTYVKKKAEFEDCPECLGSGAEDYFENFILPCSFCKGTGKVKERHYKSGVRIKYF